MTDGNGRFKMSKEIRKNREALMRYFYSLPEPDRNKSTTAFTCIEDLIKRYGGEWCLCAKGQTIQKFMDSRPDYYDWADEFGCFLYCDTNVPTELEEMLDITGDQWYEMERRYEGFDHKEKHNYSQIADWLQTLPSWPKVL